MPFFDMSLDLLHTYQPARSEPADFDAFWKKTLEEARKQPLNAKFVAYDAGLTLVDLYDVTFAGYGGQAVKGWYIRPAKVTQALPCVVEFLGYGNGRNNAHDWLLWANAGYAHFVMDTRGQGSVWSRGDTPDLPDGANPFFPGFMTQGVQSPQTYYYRRVFTDAVRAVEVVRSRSDVDGKRIAVTGGSQGGGIAIATAGLVNDVTLCMPDVPFLCHFRAAVGKTDAFPYQEIVKFLAAHRGDQERVFATLDYFDGVNFAVRINATCLFSTALMDTICPPSTVFAAYNHVTAPKHIEVYEFNEHEGGGSEHTKAKLSFVNAAWR
jgi:cephalosporin-C deacetylase